MPHANVHDWEIAASCSAQSQSRQSSRRRLLQLINIPCRPLDGSVIEGTDALENGGGEAGISMAIRVIAWQRQAARFCFGSGVASSLSDGTTTASTNGRPVSIGT
jgi:hypothetical protein